MISIHVVVVVVSRKDDTNFDTESSDLMQIPYKIIAWVESEVVNERGIEIWLSHWQSQVKVGHQSDGPEIELRFLNLYRVFQ